MTERETKDDTLTEALRAIAEDDARLTTSPAVEVRVLAEVRAIGAARRVRARRRIGALAAAAVVAAAIAVSVWRSVLKPEEESPPMNEVATDFMPLPYSAVPLTNGQIVRLEVPRSALVSFGLLPVDSVDRAPGGTVLADVIVGDDGLARAVRFVRPSVGKEHMP